MSKISIIIPCYNSEKYIDRCMNSIVNQTIGVDNLEIILVNDGSSDSTIDKILEWEKAYPNNVMIVNYEKNIGQGYARNLGIQYATSEHIGFVDSDDWIETNMYEELYSKIKDGKYDVVRCKFHREEGSETRPLFDGEQQDVEYVKETDSKKWINLNRKGNNGEYGSLCCGLYRKSLFTDNNIWFPDSLKYEDNYVGGLLKIYTNSLYIIDKVFYHYMVNAGSTTSSVDEMRHLDRMKIEIALLEEYLDRDVYVDNRYEIEWNFFYKYYVGTMFIIFTRFNVLPDIFDELKNTVNRLVPNWESNPYFNVNDGVILYMAGILKIEKILTAAELEAIRCDFLEIYSKNKTNYN